MLIIVIYLLIEKKCLNLKPTIKMFNFQTQFSLESISNRISLSLNGDVYDFSVDYNSIDKSDILNIRKYLRAKNNIK